MNTPQTMDHALATFDFNEWSELARNDPQAFEARYRALIEDTISRAPVEVQPRLRCLQWRVDMERRKHKSPLGACLSIYRMMWDSVYGERGLLDALNSLSRQEFDLKPAKVLAFRARR
jgi:hypothetical protein